MEFKKLYGLIISKITFGYVLKAPRFTFPADIVLVGSIYNKIDLISADDRIFIYFYLFKYYKSRNIFVHITQETYTQ